MSLVLQLQHLWSGSGGSVDLPVLLDSGSVMTDVHELLAALQLDQQYRWQTTAPWLAEDYLNHLTRLPAGIDWRLELVVGEFQSRPETQPLTQDQLQKRFPDLKELWQHLVRIPRQTELTEAVELVTTRLESLYGHEGTTPQLEYSLANLPVAFRSEALTRLLTVELSHLQNRGMTIIPATWTRRFPRYQSELSSIFGTPPEQPGSPDPAQTIIDPQRTLPVTHGPSGQPALLGDYELLSELGRGGMGVVYRARQRGLNRTVALKTVLAQSGGSDEDIRRFRNEAEAAAQLRHPGIVAVFDVGETDGRHYYSMEYIEGDDLSRLIRENTLPGEQAAKFVRQLAEAVQYAHDHGVLHRDLKPSNVLLDRQGTLKITDFGLARRIKADSQMTREFSVMGTPSYMPPEQAMPTRGPVGPWSDIYSLGAVLYELLTARPPFRADNPLETMRQVINDEPIAPQLLNSKIAMDLQTICLKCLEKEPSRRYDSARTLAEELSRYLEGKPILARPLGRAERFWRLCRRHPRESILAGVILSTILTAVIGITSQWRRAEANLKTAERNFDLLSRAADDMLGVVEEWVTRAPPAAGPQQEKLNSSLLLFEAFLDEEPANRKAQQRLAETHLRVAEIHRLLRHFDDAVQHQQKAIRILKVLSSAASVEQRIAEAALARAWDTMGNTEREADRPDRAASAFEQALSIQRTFLSISATPQDRSDFARTLYNRGLLRMDQNQTSPAAADFEQSISFSLQALQEDPGNGAFQQGLARCRLNLGVLLRNLGNSSAALKQYDAAIAILQNLVQALPSMNEYVVELAQAWLNRGNLLLTTRKDSVTLAEKPLEAAQASFSEAVNLLSALKAQYPNVPQYDIELANALNGLGGVQQESGDSEAARESWTRARVAFLDVLRVSGDSAELYTRLGLTMANLALLIPREHPEQRIPLLQEACSHQRSALRKKPDATLSKSYLRSHLLSLSRALIQQGNHAEAATAAEEFGALELQPTDWQTAAELLVRAMAACLEDDSLTPESQLANAESYASRAVTALRHISERDPLAIQQIAQNEKFQAIRERADFRMLLEKAAENSTKP